MTKITKEEMQRSLKIGDKLCNLRFGIWNFFGIWCL